MFTLVIHIFCTQKLSRLKWITQDAIFQRLQELFRKVRVVAKSLQHSQHA